MGRRNVRDAGELLLPAVDQAIAALETTEADAGTIQLARQYARTIDACGWHCSGCDDPDCNRDSNTWAMRWIAPLLLDALESLGATPLARTRLKSKAPAGVSQLDKLRAARRS